jgi:uncharacterized membrane protein
MIPVEQPRQEGTPFPFLGFAVAVLALYAILAVLLPTGNVVRSAVAITAFFAMGYCVLALVAGGYLRLSAAEVLAFTVGLTILITSLSALAVSIVGIPITEFAVIIVGLPIGVITWLVRRPRTQPLLALVGFGRRFFDFSDYSLPEKVLAGVLLGAIAVALAVFISLSSLSYPDIPSVGLAITGPDGTPDSLPRSLAVGQVQTIIVSALGDSVSNSLDVRIRLIPANATGNVSFHPANGTSPLHFDPLAEYRESITLGAGETWTKSYSLVVDVAGTFVLRFELVDATGAVPAASLLHLPVT